MSIEHPKEDSRPQRGMWAPGGYHCSCVHCAEAFIGDKRAVCCADCAYKPLILDIETRAPNGDKAWIDEPSIQMLTYMNGLDCDPVPVRLTFPALTRDYHASEFFARGDETNNLPDIEHDDGTTVAYKTGDVVVVGGGDYCRAERRIIGHMVSIGVDESVRAIFQALDLAIDTGRTRELTRRESLRDEMLAQACKYAVDAPRPDKPKRDWEQRNRKQRRR